MSRHVVVLVLVASLAPAGLARADRKIAIEVYSGPRPADAGRLMAPVLEELAVRGFDVGYDGIGRRFEGEVSMASRTKDGLPGDFATQIDNAHKAWTQGQFEEAQSILTPLIDAAHGNAAAIANDSKLVPLIQSALVDLALAQARLGDPGGATAAMAELVRSFPGFTVTKAKFGPEAAKLFDDTRQELAKQGTGNLIVTAAADGTQFFVNEQYKRTGSAYRDSLLPGKYRIYASLGALEGRTYVVEVKPGEDTHVDIDVQLDAVMHIDAAWTGLALDSPEARAQQYHYAVKMARLAGASAVALIGIVDNGDRMVMVGETVSMESERMRSQGVLSLDPVPNTDRRKALARYLTGDESAKGSLDDPNALATVRRTAGHRRWGAWKYVVSVIGLAGVGVGGYLLAIDGSCAEGSDPCKRDYDTSQSGWAVAGGGAAFLTLGIIMFATDKVGPERAVTLVPTRGGAMAGYSWKW